jgi:hypothetical protein
MGSRSSSLANWSYDGIMPTTKPRGTGAKGRRQKDWGRREGLRAVRIWIPDLDTATFRAEAHRQSAAIAASPGEKEDQDFIDSISGTE